MTNELISHVSTGNDQLSSGKIVTLKLSTHNEKTGKLNQMNILKQESSDELKQEKLSTIKSTNSTTDIDCSVMEQDGPSGNYIEVFGSMECPQHLQAAIKEIEMGFQKGLKPKLTDDGTSGTYLMRGVAKKPLAVFKPIDEEAFAPNNPRDHVGAFGSQSFRAGVLSGEACIREVAAYLLDKDGFSGVPSTTMIESHHESLK
jgi:hypothetical protein